MSGFKFSATVKENNKIKSYEISISKIIINIQTVMVILLMRFHLTLIKIKYKQMKAIWNNKVIAESDDIVNVEGNAYFPIESVNRELLKNSDTNTVCHWKGTASYYNIEVDGQVNKDAAWYYQSPGGLASAIKNKVAFWRGVEIVD